MRSKRIILLVALCACIVAAHAESDDLCMDGTLLFREDFGGNDPNDPDVIMESVPGMDPSYVNSGNSLGNGHYTIRKEGWSNGIQWHRQDDHTYPDDKTRGYLLEVDGIGGETPFYSKTIEGLCAGYTLTFSAYVVNVHYAGQIQWFYDNNRSYVFPRLKFVLKNPVTGEILASQSTGDIQPDWTEDWETARTNLASAEWQLVGMNFTVPEGIESIQMFIYNDVENNGAGNDFALDDIEIHLCLPPVTIEGESEVCEGSMATLTAHFTNDGTLAEPLEYKWWFSLDSLTWTERAETSSQLTVSADEQAVGWYKAAVSGAGSIENINCRAVSEPFHLTVKECEPPAPELCMGGVLLFREDFGGNDPNDPTVSTTPVASMSSGYQQVTNLEPKNNYNDMAAGKYLVTKQGYRNSTLTDYSVWHIMDDHTYPNDKTRGYLLEVDGKGGNDAFYSTSIHDLCPGTKLTFSTYIANLTTAGQYAKWKSQGRSSAHPEISFIITDLRTGAQLARYNTDTISHDWTNYPKSWRESAEWQLVGMNFTVPEGIDSVKLSIHNNVNASSGNDFALDDIEIHLCLPPVTIDSDTEVCNGATTTLHAEFANDGTLVEPLEYKWWHSSDSLTWTELANTSSTLTLASVQKANSGWYKVAVSGAGNIENVNCRAMSEPFHLRVEDCPPPISDLCMDGTLVFREDFGGNDPSDPEVMTSADAARAAVPGMSSTYTPCLSRTSGMSSGKFLVTKQGYQNGIQWHIMDDHTYPNDLTKGYLLQIDGRGDNAPFYTTTIDGLCAGSRLTFSAYVANVMTWGHYMNPSRHDIYPRLKFVLTDPESGMEMAAYDTGEIPFDSAFIDINDAWRSSAHWQLIGMNFMVPDNTDRITLTIYNNVSSNGSGNDFALDDIEIRLCAPPITIEGDAEICANTSTTLTANFSNDGTFAEPLGYKWFFSADSISWETLDETSNVLNISNVQKADSGWYKVAVSGIDNIESLNCRAMSEPFRLRVNECEPPEPPVEELCMDGTLLFREDFGGNDPSDPRVGTNPVPGMSYTQATNDVFHSMGSGKYIVTKSGYCNGDTTGWSLPGADQSTYRSQWYIQDDHTYPNDYSRGYFMEIDGSGGNQQFYQTEISGLCEGTELTFSAYVANVFTWFQYDWYTRNRGPVIAPCLKFVLTNPQTGETLVEKNTQQIPFAEDLADKTDWQYSSPWYLVGMNFIVPTGIPAIRLTIYNNVTNGNGNDFAIDDIEIRLCMPTPTIVSDHEACLDSAYTFDVNFDNDGTLAEPLEYKWWYSQDSATWVEKPDFIGANPELSAVQKADSGWYQVAASGAGSIENINCRAVSEPFRLQTVTCDPPYYHIICDTAVCHEDSITYFGHRYGAPGVYTDTVIGSNGVDTIYQLTVTDSRSFRELSIIITAGNPPPHPWEHITEAGIYYDTLVNAVGCDSIVTCYIAFKERCVESLEENQTLCAGDTYNWHGLILSEEGDYRDTLWHQQYEACDTAALLHLRMLPSYRDTTYAMITYGEEYTWEGEVWTETTTQTHRHIAANSCDSLTTLQLTVDYSLTVEQMDLESGCSADEQMMLHLLLSRPVDSVRITFSDDAKNAGLRDSIVYFHAKEGDIIIPHRSARPGRFTCDIALVHDTAVLYTASFTFTLLYPASVLEQAWNDVVAVLTHDYNGGYDFVAFQWYENSVPLTGENGSYLYKPLIMGGEYSALLTEADGTQAMTCPLIATNHEDISLYPTLIGPRRMLRCYVPEEAELILYDALGRIIGRYNLPAGETQVLAPGTTGVYIACIITRSDQKERPYKLIVR